jgi:hypothetical protein
MNPDEERITTVLLDTLMAVRTIFPSLYSPQTFISKAMLDAGVKQGLFLASLQRQDEEIDGADPLPLMGSPIYANLHIENKCGEGEYLVGNVSCFGYNIVVKEGINWNKDYTVEELRSQLEFIQIQGFVPPCR